MMHIVFETNYTVVVKLLCFCAWVIFELPLFVSYLLLHFTIIPKLLNIHRDEQGCQGVVDLGRPHVQAAPGPLGGGQGQVRVGQILTGFRQNRKPLLHQQGSD